jgi:hypothetical protein
MLLKVYFVVVLISLFERVVYEITWYPMIVEQNEAIFAYKNKKSICVYCLTLFIEILCTM